MANIASQIKRNRQNERVRLRNKAHRSTLKTDLRKFHAAVASGDADAAGAQFRVATKRLDKAASKGIVHANFAANKKSKMAQQLAGL
jgi:small subunit ribosomal protein S20